MTSLTNSARTLVRNSPALSRVHSAWKARGQERTAAAGQQEIVRRASAKGVAALSEDETATALRARLKARAAARGWPRRKGDMHVFVAFRLFDWEKVLFDAFLPFGEVTVYEWASRGFDHDAADWWTRRPDMNRDMLAAFEAANARRPVDAVIGCLSGHNTQPETLAKMAEGGAAIFNFSYDDKLDFDRAMPDGGMGGPAALAGVVDVNLTSSPEARLKYAIEGGLSLFHPETADPKIHHPFDVPFRYDVTFVGARYGFRPHFIENLRRLGVEIAAFGRDWPGGSLPMDKMVEMYSLSRINLGFGGIGHSRRLMCLKGRDFEVPLSGGLYLTQDNPDLGLVFDVGREIVTYTDEADCARKIRELLADEPRAAAIRAAGRARCLRDHTFEARWSRVFGMAGLLA